MRQIKKLRCAKSVPISIKITKKQLAKLTALSLVKYGKLYNSTIIRDSIDYQFDNAIPEIIERIQTFSDDVSRDIMCTLLNDGLISEYYLKNKLCLNEEFINTIKLAQSTLPVDINVVSNVLPTQHTIKLDKESSLKLSTILYLTEYEFSNDYFKSLINSVHEDAITKALDKIRNGKDLCPDTTLLKLVELGALSKEEVLNMSSIPNDLISSVIERLGIKNEEI